MGDRNKKNTQAEKRVSELPLQELSHTAVICKCGASELCWNQREDALLSSPG